MRIAIPVTQGKLSPHFGHCDAFALIDVEIDGHHILAQETVPAPAHEPGLLPAWLAEKGAGVILAGGMGSRARQLFEGQNIEVIVGAPDLDPESLVRAYLSGELKQGQNACDH